ncbi:MAG TPA: Rrf2 family transcriptional regulator [Usitatibacter sp.]|nr:Rrf2 family transcriptional regulator [Usitatibacter sp.]
MRLTTFTDYSLRLLIYVAGSQRERVTIAEVAEAFGISENHLVKVAHELGRAGFLDNARGRGGGMRLAAAPESIGVAQVVRATEGRDVPAECFTTGEADCPIAGHCRLEHVLGEAVESFYATLGRYTLADLVANRRELARHLHWHPPARTR